MINISIVQYYSDMANHYENPTYQNKTKHRQNWKHDYFVMARIHNRKMSMAMMMNKTTYHKK